MISMGKSFCSDAERITREKSLSKNSKVTSSQSILHFDDEMHLPVKGTRRRCAYCSTKEEQVTTGDKILTNRILNLEHQDYDRKILSWIYLNSTSVAVQNTIK
ncbi:unnamed protein product, partial [Rotaria sp. Silwood1]